MDLDTTLLGFRGRGRRDRFEFSADDDRKVLNGFKAGKFNYEIADDIGRGCAAGNVESRITAMRGKGLIAVGQRRPQKARPPAHYARSPKFHRKQSATTGINRDAHAPIFQERPDRRCPEPARLDGQPVTMMTVKDGMCRWPHGTPGHSDFHLCGVATGGRLYCEHHTRRAHAPRAAEHILEGG